MKYPELNPHLENVPLYIAGKSIQEVKQEYGLDEVIKLASNESAVGASPAAMHAIQQLLEHIYRYPGFEEHDLRCKIAAHLGAGFTENHILTGNGGTDILRMIAHAFLFDGRQALMGKVSFPMYRIFTISYGGVPVLTDMNPQYGFDLAAMANQIDVNTKVVFLCSPNNPTGAIIHQAEMDAFLDRVPEHCLVVYDEAYVDFIDDPNAFQALNSIQQRSNMLIVRSFSKSAGLANLRMGYAVGQPEVIHKLLHAKMPFHSNDLSLAAASASLDDHEFLAQNRQAVIAGRQYLFQQLQALDLNALPSQANFLSIIDPPRPPQDIVQDLLLKGFIVRPMQAFGLPNAFRVSVGTMDENKKFIHALKSILENIPS